MGLYQLTMSNSTMRSQSVENQSWFSYYSTVYCVRYTYNLIKSFLHNFFHSFFLDHLLCVVERQFSTKIKWLISFSQHFKDDTILLHSFIFWRKIDQIDFYWWGMVQHSIHWDFPEKSGIRLKRRLHLCAGVICLSKTGCENFFTLFMTGP